MRHNCKKTLFFLIAAALSVSAIVFAGRSGTDFLGDRSGIGIITKASAYLEIPDPSKPYEPSLYESCESDDDCLPSQSCSNGSCIIFRCGESNPCRGEERYCGSDNLCKRGCLTNNDCISPQVCENNRCLANCNDNPCGIGTFCDTAEGLCKPGCLTNANCSAMEICSSGSCVPRCGIDSCGAGTYCDSVSGICTEGCLSGNDCASGEACIDSRCIASSGCRTDFDCPSPQVCSDGACDTNPTIDKHKTNFLTSAGRGGCHTHIYPGKDASWRSNCINQVKSQPNNTHLYVYAYNEGDYQLTDGYTPFNYFARPGQFADILQGIIGSGLKPVVWLIPDDAPAIARTNTATLRNWFNNLVGTIDPYVSSYVLGLEIDEYWNTSYREIYGGTIINGRQKAMILGNHLDTLTKKPIGNHQIQRRLDYCIGTGSQWCDMMVYQYGWNLSEAEIISITRQAIQALGGKAFIAGEHSYNEPASVGERQGNAAMSAGAAGFGNGCRGEYCNR